MKWAILRKIINYQLEPSLERSNPGQQTEATSAQWQRGKTSMFIFKLFESPPTCQEFESRYSNTQKRYVFL